MGKLLILLLFSYCSCKQVDKPQNIVTSLQKPVDTVFTSELGRLLQNADSIVLISHILTSDYNRVVDDDINDKGPGKNEQKINRKYLKDGRVNPEIIIESVRADKSKKQLIDILLLNPEKGETNSIRCNMPHHSILIYNSNKQSYIDICFHCEKIHPSVNIQLSEEDFDKRKWQLLEKYFKLQGIEKMYE